MAEAALRHRLLLRSPANALSRLAPWAVGLLSEVERRQASGEPLPGESLRFLARDLASAGEMEPTGPAAEHAGLARRLVDAMRDVVVLWEANSGSDGSCPPLPDFIAALAVARDPGLASWGSSGSAAAAFRLELQAATRAHLNERASAARAASLSGMSPGVRVTLLGIGEDPEEQAVVASGSRADGFLLEDGRRLREAPPERADSSRAWIVERNGSATGLWARPEQPLDRELVLARAGRLGDDGTETPRRARPLPKSEFVAANARREGRFGSSGDDLDTDRMVAEIMPRGDYGRLLAYMLRRFGPATGSADEYKDMCGSWLLTTPREDTRLLVRPSPVGMAFSVHPLLSGETRQRLALLRRAMSNERYGRAEGDAATREFIAEVAPLTRALRGTLCDLLRPVHVRDSAINALGEVRDGSPLLAWTGDDDAPDGDKPVHAVGYCAASTVGIPEGLLDDPDAWRELLVAMRCLDPENWASAMRKAVAAMQGPDAEPGGAAPGR